MAALPFLTDAACNIFIGFWLGLFWLALALAWACFPLNSPDLVRSRAAWRWWLAAGVAGCLGLSLAFTDCGLLVRVALCRPWLDDYAARVLASDEERSDEPRWVGLFFVRRTERTDGMVFLYTHFGFVNSGGLAWLPPGRRLPTRIWTVGRLVGRWHSFGWDD